MKKEQFENVIKQAISSLPEEFANGLKNIEIVVEDRPSFEEPGESLLLGLYEGVPLDQRGDPEAFAGALPDRITLFKKNIEEVCEDEAEMVREIRITLLHEIGHYFGMTEEELKKIGYG